MNISERIDAQIVIADELRQGLLETWNAGELSGDVLMALEQAGFTVERREGADDPNYGSDLASVFPFSSAAEIAALEGRA
jgi:hypothetical protein